MRWLQGIRRALNDYGPAASRWMVGVGVVLLGVAAVFAGRSWSSTRGLVRATAVVTENAATFAPGGGVQYVPRVRFRVPSGEIVQALCGPGSDEVEFPAGASVPVIYGATDPGRAIIATRWRVYKGGIVLAISGTLLVDLGLLLLFFRPRPQE